MENKKLIQIVTPAYNEEETLDLLYERLTSIFDKLSDKYNFEIIIVIERSSDKTFEKGKNLTIKDSRVKLIHFSRQFGHQIALKAGLDHADADAVIMMDSDLQHPPELIEKMLYHYEKGYNIVFTQKKIDHRNIIKRFVSKLFYSTMKKISRTTIIPYSTDFRLIDKKVLTIFKDNINEFDPFLRGIFSWMGFRKSIIKYDVQKRAAGESKYNLKRLAHLATAGITSFSTFPLQIGIYLGGFMVLISIVLLFILLIYFFIYKDFQLYLFISFLIVLFGSIQILLIGLLGEYLGRIFLEQKQRPLYIIDEKIGFTE